MRRLIDKSRMSGDVHVRFRESLRGKFPWATRLVCAFQYAEDAERFYKVLPKRLQRFNLDVAAEKTSLIRFSRFQPSRKRQFVFLGFAFYWGTDSQGKPRLRRRTAAKKQKTTLNALYLLIKASRSRKLSEWLPQLNRTLRGFSNYFGLPDNSRSLAKLYTCVLHGLYKWLNRRSGRRSYNWRQFKEMLGYFQIERLRVRKRVIDVDWY